MVTKPFFFEGGAKQRLAEEGVSGLEPFVDSLVIVPNDRLMRMSGANLALNKAFKLADSALKQAVLAMADVVTHKGEINVDFADVRSVLTHGGRCYFALGQDNRNSAAQAARKALASPFLDTDLTQARKALLVVSGSRRLKLGDVQAASEVVQKALHPDAHIIFGVTTDQSLKDEIRVTLIASAQPAVVKPVDTTPVIEIPDIDASIAEKVEPVAATNKMVDNIEQALENSLPLWNTDEPRQEQETECEVDSEVEPSEALSGVIRDIDSEFREITIAEKKGKLFTLVVNEATHLVKDSRDVGFERLSVGDRIQPVSMYKPSTGILDKLVVARGRVY